MGTRRLAFAESLALVWVMAILVVIEGALQERGMVSFAPIFSDDDAEAIRAFVVQQANLSSN